MLKFWKVESPLTFVVIIIILFFLLAKIACALLANMIRSQFSR